MKQTDQRLDSLAVQVGNIENEIFSEDGEEIQVNHLLQSVHEVKSNYQNLRKELLEVQDLQKQLSSSLHLQLKVMQSRFNTLKEKIYVPPTTTQSSDRLVPRSRTPGNCVEDN